ncbi:nuclear transport factor 2 family protein [Maricaulis sp.]|uniref:YybH family protein n=1 Tax=Maricaulis sp. TaxID=1486257 RepID=UPI002B2748E4|nr:nuclear transport factor 2 family protein [Maricaulis sp.]
MARAPKSDIQLLGDKQAARAIAAARADFNAALENRALKAIATHLAEDAVLVPGDEAQLITGRAAQIDAWASIFSQMPDVSYVRTPSRIEVCEDSQLAAETGRWKGAWSTDGFAIRYSGRYFAKWRCDDGVWQIEAETFVTMKRSGGADQG